MHVYSIIDFNLLLCLELEYINLEITTLSISKKNLFVLIGFSNGEIDIYKLPTTKSEKNEKLEAILDLNSQGECECLKELEKETLKNSMKNSATSYIFRKINKLKNQLFEGEKIAPFAKYKCSSIVHINNHSNSSNHNNYMCFFEKKNEFTIIANRFAEKIKFNSIEGGIAWSFKSLDYRSDNNSNK